MDWQHLLMNGESLGEYAALLASEGVLGHQHANSGWGTFDDDNMVGATAFMETLELAVELRRVEVEPEPLPVVSVSGPAELHRELERLHERRRADHVVVVERAPAGVRMLVAEQPLGCEQGGVLRRGSRRS